MPTDADMPPPPPRDATGRDFVIGPLMPPEEIPPAGLDLGILRIAGRAYAVRAFPPNPANKISHAGRPVYFLRGVRGGLYWAMRNVPNPDRLFLVSGGRSLATLAWLTDAGGVLRVAG